MSTKRNSITIDSKISITILTPLTCAFLVNEVIKLLVYQKSQIPYPYNWLKTIITRKRRSLDATSVTPYNISVERHYNIVSSTYSAIEDIMSNIKTEFRNFTCSVKEILIIFGATPFTPKEVFRINIPLIDVNHVEANHLKTVQKDQQKILRDIFFSKDWLYAMDFSCPTTNMYIMIRKCIRAVNEDNFFTPIRDYSIPSNFPCVTINLDYRNERNHTCCSNMTVYNDSSSSQYYQYTNDNDQIANDLEDCWFQAKIFVKGYKDCFINKMSATELF